MSLRKLLWNAGYRYRKNFAGLPGTPDIAITRFKIAVFCDGEFFHGKDWETVLKQRVARGQNAEFWLKKIEHNIKHDAEVDRQLTGLGWTVLRFWGHDIRKHPDRCIKAVEEAILEKQITAYDMTEPAWDDGEGDKNHDCHTSRMKETFQDP